jgi:putative membrane protein
MDGTDWLAMGIWMVFLLIVVVLVVWAITQWGRSPSHYPTSGKSSAREILDERFARGEIDVDEYHQRREALDKPPSPGTQPS